MVDSFSSHVISLLIWSGVMLIAVGVGVCIVRAVRGEFRDNASTTQDLITNFRELRSKGGLSDGEYRTIKSVLTAQLQKELKDNDKTD